MYTMQYTCIPYNTMTINILVKLITVMLMIGYKTFNLRMEYFCVAESKYLGVYLGVIIKYLGAGEPGCDCYSLPQELGHV